MFSSVQGATPSPFKRALLTFLLWYVVGILVVGAFQFFISGTQNSGMAMGALVAAGLVAHMKFSQLAGRVPDGNEPVKLAALSTLIALVVSLIPVAVLLWVSGFSLDQILSEGGATGTDALKAFVIILPIMIALYFFALWAVYGPLGRYVHRKSQKP